MTREERARKFYKEHEELGRAENYTDAIRWMVAFAEHEIAIAKGDIQCENN